MQVNEAIAAELARRGVTGMFSLPSNEMMRVIIEAGRRGITTYRTRHEHAAIGMADGFARVSGKVGVAMIGMGPGITNGINAAITARKGGSRVLLLTGTAFVSADANPHLNLGYAVGKKDIDQIGFLTASGIPPIVLSSPESAVADFGAAFERVASGMTLAVLIPVDVGQAEAGNAPARVALPPLRSTQPARATDEDIALVADLLEETWAAGRPLIIAGRGAVESHAKDDLVRIGDSIGALFATSLMGKGLFAGHPYDLGVMGTMCSPTASELIPRSDLVLCFGAGLGPFTTMAGDLLEKARIVRIDANPGVFGAKSKAAVSIVADAGLAAAQLAAELERRAHRTPGWRTPEIATDIAASHRPAIGVPKAPNTIAPEVLGDLDRLLPSPRTMVIDTTSHVAYSGRYLSASNPEWLVMPSEYSSVGAGQGVALGACIACPERTTVLTMGDGALMMTLADLDTAVRYKLPLIVLVMNNGGFAAESNNLALEGLPDDLALYANPDFAGVARALGAEGITVRSPEDLRGLGERLASRRGPVLVDCHLAIDASTDWAGVSHRMHTAAATPAGAR